MIEIVKPEKQYVPKIGDVLWGAAADWAKPDDPDWESKPEYQQRKSGLSLNVLDGTEFTDNEILLMTHVHPNPIKALERLEIDTRFFCPHTDPYTEYKVYSIIPTAVLTDRVRKYEPKLKHLPFLDLTMDQDFVKDHYKGELLEKNWKRPAIQEIFTLTPIQEQMMGSGYNCGCNMNDGDKSCLPAKVKLSNDDWLFVWFWEWYNK